MPAIILARASFAFWPYGCFFSGAAIEADDRLRESIRLAPESFIVAGSSGEYEARTLEVSSNIVSVAVVSPEPGIVDVRFVLTDGELPDQPMIDLVQGALSSETDRPLTDKVLVSAPDAVPFSVKGKWYLSETDATLLASDSPEGLQFVVQNHADTKKH